MNPFANAGNIQIRLTRRNETEETDDRICIKYKDENMYQIFFQDGNMLKKTTFCTVLSGEELDVYVESLFVLLSRDRDPFRSIEFQIPCFPALQYTVKDLQRGKIRNTLKRVMPLLYSAARF